MKNIKPSLFNSSKQFEVHVSLEDLYDMLDFISGTTRAIEKTMVKYFITLKTPILIKNS